MRQRNGKSGSVIKLWSKVCFFFVILFAGYFLFVIYPSSINLFLDSYCHNKLALVISFLEDYKVSHNNPPVDLKEVGPKINQMLEKNVFFRSKYFPSSWTKKDIPLFMMPVVGKAYSWQCTELNYLADKNDYYLYYRQRPTKVAQLNLDDLKSVVFSPKSSCEKFKGFVIVYNGKIIYGMMKQNTEPYSLHDLEKNMRKPIGLPPLWFYDSQPSVTH